MEKGPGFNAPWLLEAVTTALRELGYDPQLPPPSTRPAPFHAVLHIQLANCAVDVWVPKQKGSDLLLRQPLTLLEQEFKCLHPLEISLKILSRTSDVYPLLLRGLLDLSRLQRQQREKYQRMSHTSNIIESFPRPTQRAFITDNRAYHLDNVEGEGRGKCEIDSRGLTMFTLYDFPPEKTQALLELLYGKPPKGSWEAQSLPWL